MVKNNTVKIEAEVFDIVEGSSSDCIDNTLQTDTLPAEFFQFFEIEEISDSTDIPA